jgi:hypothetical protein
LNSKRFDPSATQVSSDRRAYGESVAFFALDDDEQYLGTPDLAPGARVRFDPGRLFDAMEREAGHPVDRRVPAGAGLLVHDHATEVLRWPSSLWRVEDPQWARPVRSGDRWKRCRAFTVVEQAPTWLVAGPHGYAVQWVVNRARALTADQVAALVALPGDDEEPLSVALWKHWLQGHRGDSPVGCGLMTLVHAIDEAARRVGGPELFGLDQRDGVVVLSDPVWQDAGHAAYGAALAFGAPDLLSPEQNAVLARRWTTVFGMPEAPV